MYMQARYYDPVIGRFYSNDPIGVRDIHSFNRYAYANNNPYKYVDPTGMAPDYFGECARLCVGSNQEPVSTGGWSKTGTAEDGVARYSYTGNQGNSSSGTNVVNTVNVTNSSLGYMSSVGSQIFVNADGNWLGKNGKYYSPKFNGNGPVGGRTVAYGKANALKLFGRVSFVGSAGISVYNYNTPGGPSMTKTAADIGMAAVGFIWPFGTIVSAAYFGVDLSNGGDWSRKPTTTY